MKKSRKNNQIPAAPQTEFRNIAENLYRLESSGGYYALVKKSGKQFRRSLKTKYRKLADRRVKELKEQIGVLSVGDDARPDFETVANRRLQSVQHSPAPGTIQQRKITSPPPSKGIS